LQIRPRHGRTLATSPAPCPPGQRAGGLFSHGPHTHAARPSPPAPPRPRRPLRADQSPESPIPTCASQARQPPAARPAPGAPTSAAIPMAPSA
jgi:hypothetical protein